MTLLGDLTLSEIASRIGAMLIFAFLQGLVLAGLARALGDRRPELEGRLSPNPFAQLSLWGMALGVLFTMGWVRPLHYDVSSNRLGGWGVLLVIVGGLGAMALLVPAIDLLRPLALLLPRSGGYAVLYWLSQLQLLVAGAVALNLLPIPGLVAGAIWQAVWPGQGRRLGRHEALGLAVVTVAVVAGLVPALGPVVLPYLSLVGR
ncbi:MAG TPA: hypothetical protein VGV07_22820 [Devosia sp.]|jgi:hypothetical protein|uniref:hypothetical protein n=1 Tax=Devosia sp. TaxID=1871048 RepID=UPI002DDD4400|nr:hypothetical protein [Devosia sp.]HEV2518102.1 hypothetical protein [Devosia sp.]